MSPPIHKDWWLAAALTGAALPAAVAQPAQRQPAGVVTRAEAGKPVTMQTLYADSIVGQKINTGPGQSVHVLFPDQSALTIGPNSEVVLSKFDYDPQKKDGNILVDMSKGFLRVVGGFISKRNEVQVRTATATIGVRGGITLAETDGQKTSGTFVFGQSMKMTDSRGGSRTVTRPGFGMTSDGNGLSEPNRSNPNFGGTGNSGNLDKLDPNRLNDRAGGGGGGGGGGGTNLRDILGTGQTPNQS